MLMPVIDFFQNCFYLRQVRFDLNCCLLSIDEDTYFSFSLLLINRSCNKYSSTSIPRMISIRPIQPYYQNANKIPEHYVQHDTRGRYSIT